MISLILTTSLIFSRLLFADVILLKSGGIMQGEVLSETDKSIEFKNPSGAVEKIKKELIASIVKREEKLPLIPEEAYLDKLKSISPTDAKAHYELGLFCLENSLLDYALKEFNQAKNIDTEYEDIVLKHIKYIASVKEKAEKMMGVDKEVKEEDTPPLTLTRITKELKKGDLPIPYSHKDTELIIKAINSYNNKLKKEYAQRYIELGSYLEKAPIRKPQAENNKKPDIALFCYEIAYNVAQDSQTNALAQQKIISFKKYLEEKKKEGLIIPYSKLDKDVIILFIKGLEDKTEKSSYYGRYYYMGDEFKAMVKDCIPPKEEGRQSLRIALYCYQITKSAYAGSILGSGLIEAKVRECKERLLGKNRSALQLPK